MLRWLFIILLLLPISTLADPDVTRKLEKAPPPAPKTPEAPVSDPLTGTRHSLKMDKLTRTYHLYVPSRSSVQPRPLVIVLHGGGGNAKGIAETTGFTRLADRENFIVAYPEGTGHLPTWNAGRCCGYAARTDVDDADFIKALITDVRRAHLVDKTRIYAAGFSNGGMMAYRLACDIGEYFSAIAVVGGAMNTQSCQPKARPSIVIFHAKNDGEVPFDGGVSKTGYRAALAGKPMPDASVKDAMDFWIKANLCRNFPSQEEKPDGLIVNYFCAQGRDLRLYSLNTGGHHWPGSTPKDTGKPAEGEEAQEELPSSLPATELIWDFFRKHPPREVF